MQWLDTLGFDEVWVGEHHSAGWETISCPEIFIGIAADRTRHIKLGTGVISLRASAEPPARLDNGASSPPSPSPW